MKYLLTVISIFWLTITAVAQSEIHREFPFDNQGEIEITNARGEIHVTGWDKEKIQIDAIKQGNETLFEQVQLNVIEGSKYLKIEARYLSNLRNAPSLELHISVPRGVTLKSVQSSSGTISISNIEGLVLAQTLSGDIIAKELKNNCTLSAHSGKVLAEKIEGRVDARTLSGDIKLENIGGVTNAVSASGDISAHQLRSKTMASTSSGNIRLEQVSGTVNASATSGDVIIKDVGGDLTINNISGDLNIAQVAGRVTVTGVSTNATMHSIGAGVRMTSVSGDIELDEVKGLTEIRSTNGDITMRLIDSSDVRINSHSGTIIFDGTIKENGRYSFESFDGDITVYASANSNFVIAAKSFSGEISNDFNFKATGTRPTQLQGSSGNETGATITITTFNSDITLRKQK